MADERWRIGALPTAVKVGDCAVFGIAHFRRWRRAIRGSAPLYPLPDAGFPERSPSIKPGGPYTLPFKHRPPPVDAGRHRARSPPDAGASRSTEADQPTRQINPTKPKPACPVHGAAITNDQKGHS